MCISQNRKDKVPLALLQCVQDALVRLKIFYFNQMKNDMAISFGWGYFFYIRTFIQTLG